MVKRLNEEMIEQILSMNETQLIIFMNSLKPDTLEYLDIILAKAENDPRKLKQYLDNKNHTQ